MEHWHTTSAQMAEKDTSSQSLPFVPFQPLSIPRATSLLTLNIIGHFCLAWNFGSMTSHSVTLGSGFIPSAFHLRDSSRRVGVDHPLTAVWYSAPCVCVCLSYCHWALGWPWGRPWGMGRTLGASVWRLSCTDGSHQSAGRERMGGLAPGPPPERLPCHPGPRVRQNLGPSPSGPLDLAAAPEPLPTGWLALKSGLSAPWALKIWRGRSRMGSQEACYRAALLSSSPHPPG